LVASGDARRVSTDHARRARLVRAAHRGDRAARARLVELYLPLVRRVAVRYGGLGLPQEDLVQEGVIGLLDAVARYDPGRNPSFESYARFRIRRSIKGALTDQARLIRLPKHIVERRRTIAQAEARLLARGADPTTESVAGETGLSIREIIAAQTAPRTLLSPDDAPVPDGAACDPVEEALTDELVAEVARTVARLPEQQRWVLAHRWGTENNVPRSARALAADLGLSPRRTQTIARDALDTLRSELGGFDAD